MEKTIELILERRTIRLYTERKLTKDEINTLLECAKWAPSARNAQGCVVRCVADKEKLDELNKDFKDLVGYDTPAYTRWDVNPVYQTAPALFFIYADCDRALDAGIMVENIAIGAEALGLGSCIIGSVGQLMNAPEGAKWKEYLGVPEDSKFMISIAVGEKAESPEPKPRKDGEFKLV